MEVINVQTELLVRFEKVDPARKVKAIREIKNLVEVMKRHQISLKFHVINLCTYIVNTY